MTLQDQVLICITECLPLYIEYTDGENHDTKRTVFPVGFHRAETGDLAFGAWCNLRAAYRTFLLRRVTFAHIHDTAPLYGLSVVAWVVHCRYRAVIFFENRRYPETRSPEFE